MKKLTIFILMLSFNTFFSQETTLKYNSIIILVNQKDSLISSYHVSSDTSSISLSIYINGFESKIKREKIISDNKKKMHTKRKQYIELPTFAINFLSLEKPEKLVSLEGIKYISAKDFSKSNFKTTNPTFIIVKQNDGSFLKWKTFVLPIE
ncbi:hypothetical protein [Flavobacterium sp.]|uniref:hypothetical protein n=1 Tax=Flavobacterium sp. TaxID=239 RepID=UPI003752B502